MCCLLFIKFKLGFGIWTFALIGVLLLYPRLLCVPLYFALANRRQQVQIVIAQYLSCNSKSFEAHSTISSASCCLCPFAWACGGKKTWSGTGGVLPEFSFHPCRHDGPWQVQCLVLGCPRSSISSLGRKMGCLPLLLA